MTMTTRNLKIAEIETLIANLHAELDACPNRLWESEGNQYRLGRLVELTAKLHDLEAESFADTTEETPMHDLESFVDAYIDAALFSSTDESNEQGGEPMDRNYTRSDLSPETVELMTADSKDFLDSFGAMIPEDRTGEAARDFWFTRNGHGCGFWDGDWDDDMIASDDRRSRNHETIGAFLADISSGYGSFDLYVGDDGMIHGS